MTTNRMGLEQTLSDERLEQISNEAVSAERIAMARELLARRKANKPVMFIDGDISPSDAEKLAAAIREFNSEPSDSVCMAVTVPDGWIKFSEQAPPLRTPLLVCSGNGVVQLTLYGFDGEHWQDWYEEFDPIKVDRFDWWQLLPTAPKR